MTTAAGVRSWRAALRRAPAPLGLMALIFYLSGQSDPGPDVAAAVRMLAHAGEFGLLAALWAWALAPWLGLRRAIPAAAAIALAYAISDEYHQTLVPRRDGDPFDVMIDAAGIGLATLVALALRLRIRRAGANVGESHRDRKSGGAPSTRSGSDRSSAPCRPR